MTLLFLFLICRHSEPWHLQNTEIYTPIWPGQIAVSEDLNFYILDRIERKILKYDHKNPKKTIIGRKGEGPGELNQPMILDYFQNRLFVFEARRIHEFTKSGNFVKRYPRPAEVSNLWKIKSGWLALRGLSYFARVNKGPLELVWFDEDLKLLKIIHAWESESARTGTVYSSDPRQYFSRKFNPVEEISFFFTDLNRGYAYVLPSGLNIIYVFNLEEKQLVNTLDFNSPRIPFNLEWGRKAFIHANIQRKEADVPYDEATDFPDFFPAIMTAGISRKNRLVVARWSHNPPNYWESNFHERSDLLVFDETGTPVPDTSVERYMDRIVTIDGETAYVLFRNSKEEYTISRCLLKELEHFNKKNPLSYSPQ